MDLAKLRSLAEKALTVDYMSPSRVAFDAAANPQTILELCDELEYYRQNSAGWQEKSNKHFQELEQLRKDAIPLIEMLARMTEWIDKGEGTQNEARAFLTKYKGRE